MVLLRRLSLYSVSRVLTVVGLFLTAGFWLFHLLPTVDTASGYLFHRIRAVGLLSTSAALLVAFPIYASSRWILHRWIREAGTVTTATIDSFYAQSYGFLAHFRTRYSWTAAGRTCRGTKHTIGRIVPPIAAGTAMPLRHHPDRPALHRVELPPPLRQVNPFPWIVPPMLAAGGVWFGFFAVRDDLFIPNSVIGWLIFGSIALAWVTAQVLGANPQDLGPALNRRRRGAAEQPTCKPVTAAPRTKPERAIGESPVGTAAAQPGKPLTLPIPSDTVVLADGNPWVKAIVAGGAILLGGGLLALAVPLAVSGWEEGFGTLAELLLFGGGLLVFGLRYRSNHRRSFVRVDAEGIRVRTKDPSELGSVHGRYTMLAGLYERREYTEFAYRWQEIAALEWQRTEIEVVTIYDTRRRIPVDGLSYADKKRLRETLEGALAMAATSRSDSPIETEST